MYGVLYNHGLTTPGSIRIRKLGKRCSKHIGKWKGLRVTGARRRLFDNFISGMHLLDQGNSLFVAADYFANRNVNTPWLMARTLNDTATNDSCD